MELTEPGGGPRVLVVGSKGRGQIAFAPKVSVFATMLTHGGEASTNERRRWEYGRDKLRRTMLGPLLRSSHLGWIEKYAAAVELLMRETSTLGIRRHAAERHVAERELVEVATPLGAVRVKRKCWQGQDMGAVPEYEDGERLARDHNLPLREVYRMALEGLSVQREE